LKRLHPEIYKEYEDQREGKSADANQSSMSDFLSVSEGQFYAAMNPRQKLLTNSLVENLIVKCGLPVSVVDNPYLRKFVRDLDSKFVIPCRQTVSNSILPHLLKTQNETLKKFLDSCEHLALTADIWTDRRAHAFFGITVHAFHDGQPSSKLLAFKAFHGSHTGPRIAETMEAVISDN